MKAYLVFNSDADLNWLYLMRLTKVLNQMPAMFDVHTK